MARENYFNKEKNTKSEGFIEDKKIFRFKRDINQREGENEKLQAIRDWILFDSGKSTKPKDSRPRNFPSDWTIEEVDEKMKSVADDLDYLEEKQEEYLAGKDQEAEKESEIEPEVKTEIKEPKVAEKEAVLSEPEAKPKVAEVEKVEKDESPELIKRTETTENDDGSLTHIITFRKEEVALAEPKEEITEKNIITLLSRTTNSIRDLDVKLKRLMENPIKNKDAINDVDSRLAEKDGYLKILTKKQGEFNSGKPQTEKQGEPGAISPDAEVFEGSNAGDSNKDVTKNLASNADAPPEGLAGKVGEEDLSPQFAKGSIKEDEYEGAQQVEKDSESTEKRVLPEGGFKLDLGKKEEVPTELSSPEAFFEFAKANTHNGKIDQSAFSKKHTDYYKLNKQEIKRIEALQKEELKNPKPEQVKSEPSVPVASGGESKFLEGLENRKSVSDGARDFIKAQDTKEDKYGWDFNKEEIKNVAEERGVSSTGDKSKIIDRLIKQDLENLPEKEEQKSPELIKRTETTENDDGSLDHRITFTEKETVYKIPEEIDDRVFDKLQSFGIKKLEHVAEKMPGFFELSPDKQIYALNKIDQKIYLDTDLRSKIQQENKEENFKIFPKPKNLLMKVINPLSFLSPKKIWLRITKDFYRSKLHNKMIEEDKQKGLEGYEDDMNTIIHHMSGMPDLSYKKNKSGKIVPVFEYYKTAGTEEVKADKLYWNKRYFNEAASHFGEIPQDWSGKTASKSQQKIYKKAKLEFDKRKSILLDSLSSTNKKENPDQSPEDKEKKEAEILANTSDIEASVSFNRSVMNNPEIEKASRDILRKIFGADISKTAKAGAFMEAGVFVRSFTESAYGLYAGIGAAGIIGGLLSLQKKNFEYKEKESKLKQGIDKKDKGIKRFGDAIKSSDRINLEISKIGNEQNENKKQKLILSLKNRISVVFRMVEENRMNYKDKLGVKKELFDSIANARRMVILNESSENDLVDEEKLFRRLTFAMQDRLAQRYRHIEKAKSVVIGMTIGSAAYYVGWKARDAVAGHVDSAITKIKEIIGSIKLPNLSDIMSSVDLPKSAVNYERGFDVSKVGLDNVKDSASLDSSALNSASAGEQAVQYPEDSVYPERPTENTGYATTRTLTGDELEKPNLTREESFYQNGVGEKFGAPEVRGEFKFIKDVNGNIVDVDTSRVKSDVVIEFRKNPGNFLAEDLDKTNLPFKTESYGIKNLTNNKDTIEDLIIKKNIFDGPKNELFSVPDSASRPLTPEEISSLKEMIANKEKEVAELTGGAFSDGSEKIVPEKVSTPDTLGNRTTNYFETDASRGKEDSPFDFSKTEKPAEVEKPATVFESGSKPKILGEDIIKIDGKEFKVPFAEKPDGSPGMYIPEAGAVGWDKLLTAVEKNEALGEFLKPNYYQKVSENLSANGGRMETSFQPVFERFVAAEKLLDSGEFDPGTAKYEALVKFAADRKLELIKRFGDIFK